MGYYDSRIKASFLITLLVYLQVFISAFDSDALLDVLDHPILDFIYYMVFSSVFGFLLVSLSRLIS